MATKKGGGWCIFGFHGAMTNRFGGENLIRSACANGGRRVENIPPILENCVGVYEISRSSHPKVDFVNQNSLQGLEIKNPWEGSGGLGGGKVDRVRKSVRKHPGGKKDFSLCVPFLNWVQSVNKKTTTKRKKEEKERIWGGRKDSNNKRGKTQPSTLNFQKAGKVAERKKGGHRKKRPPF